MPVGFIAAGIGRVAVGGARGLGAVAGSVGRGLATVGRFGARNWRPALLASSSAGASIARSTGLQAAGLVESLRGRAPGLFVEIYTQDGRPVLAEHRDRLENLSAVFEGMAEFIDQPSWYTRPDRLLGETSRAASGRLINWSPGYIPHHTIRIGPQDFEIVTTRPFHPIFNRAGRREIARRVGSYVAGGTLRRQRSAVA